MVTEIKGYQQKAQQAAQPSLAIVSAQERAAIEIYDPEVRSAIEQYKAGLAIKDATIQEYAALAMLCRSHDLDAWNGEAWIIPGHGVMVGIKGTRKAAWQQLPAGAHYNANPRMIQRNEYEKYGIAEETPPKGKEWKTGSDGERFSTWSDNPIVMAFVSEMTRSDATDKWIEQAERITKLTGSYEEAIRIVGPRPIWVGIGVVRKLDQSKMEMVQLARKRSESDATKQAFNLPFAIDLERGEDLAQVGDVVDGEAQVVSHPQHADPRPTQEEKKLERPASPEALRDYVRAQGGPAGPGYEVITEKQAKIANGLIKGLFKGSATQNADAQSYLEFVAAASHVADISKKTASVLIDLIKSEEPDDWSPSQVAVDEAARVLRECYVEEGQIEMFEEEGDIVKETITPEVAEKPVVSAQVAPIAEGKIAVEALEPAPKKAEPKAKPKAEPKKAEEKPVEPVKDNGEDATVLAMKRSTPQSWVVACEWLNDTFKTHFVPSKLREAVAEKMNRKDFEALSPAQGWQAAIEVAQDAAAVIATIGK